MDEQGVQIKPFPVFYKFFPESIKAFIIGFKYFQFIFMLIVRAVVVVKRNLPLVLYAKQTATALRRADIKV